MKNKYIHAGFTLPELLAVLVIIAILSSLSLGYYKRAVEQSRFSEGLSVASALVEAVNQAYFEVQMEGTSEEDAVRLWKIDSLDFHLPNSSACASASNYCIKTPRGLFELQIEEEAVSGRPVVRAYRGTVAAPKDYYIQIWPVFGSNESGANKNQIACVGVNDNGKTFCESIGYTECTESGVCTK